MILELDVGNSRIKWRVVDFDSRVLDQGTAIDLADLAAGMSPINSLTHCRICSVRRSETLNEVVQWLADRFSLTPTVAAVTSTCGPVTNQYKDPARLGVDRWLAMLAAYKWVQGACVIIDAGTALTLDVLDSSGLHQGGFILPGLSLMARSLEENTAIRLSKQGQVPSISLGHSTDQAVRNGILATVVAIVEKSYAEQFQNSSGAVRLILTGGDADVIAATIELSWLSKRAVSGLSLRAEIIKDLVLDGLVIACPVVQEGSVT